MLGTEVERQILSVFDWCVAGRTVIKQTKILIYSLNSQSREFGSFISHEQINAPADTLKIFELSNHACVIPKRRKILIKWQSHGSYHIKKLELICPQPKMFAWRFYWMHDGLLGMDFHLCVHLFFKMIHFPLANFSLESVAGRQRSVAAFHPI